MSVGQHSVEVDSKVSQMICLTTTVTAGIALPAALLSRVQHRHDGRFIEKLLCAWSDLACLSWQNERRENLYSIIYGFT